MRILELTLATPAIEAQKHFYTSILGLPLLTEYSQSFTVQAGQTRLTFQATSQLDVVYHFAFNIPRNQFAQAKQWLLERVPLLKEGEADQFRASRWPGYLMYFRDAANNILEFIAPEELPIEAEGAFGPQHLLCICEIGLAVNDVSAQVAALEAHFGGNHYQGSNTFAPVGDINGRCIVVETGRHWFPTTTAAVVAPFEVITEGGEPHLYRASGFPYTFEIVIEQEQRCSLH